MHFQSPNNSFGNCSRWAKGYGDDPLADNEVIVEDDEGWGAVMGPQFGCVLWQGRVTLPKDTA